MVLWVCWFAYAASVWTVTTGDPLTADMWNAVASNYSYSTTEVDTWKTWVDGKPVYRKVIDFGALPNATLKSLALNLTNHENIISVSWFAKAPGGVFYLPLPYSSYSNIIWNVDVYITNGTLEIRTWVDKTNYTETYLFIEYTKTTD